MSRASSPQPSEVIVRSWQPTWFEGFHWIPTNKEAIIQSERRLLSLAKAPYHQEQVNIGTGPSGSSIRWFRSASSEPRFINTVTFENESGNAPILVMVHGYGASHGFFFRNFDALACHFRVIAIDQLGWGASSRPDFSCKSTEETEAWFVDSFEEWRKAKQLEKFILLGHSFGGYIAAKYALLHPEHVQHLILVGPAGFTVESDERSERLLKFRSTWRGATLNHLWEFNITPQKVVRTIGRWGPDVVKKYTTARFGTRSVGNMLRDDEAHYLSDYLYHTSAAKASGELCLRYIFAFGGFARRPLLARAPDWKVPTSFIYGTDDWMNYRGAQDACLKMEVPKEIIRVPKGGHFVFLDNAEGFLSAVLYSCRHFLTKPAAESFLELPDDLVKVL